MYQPLGSVSGLTTWWCHDMETFPAWLALCEGNPSPADSRHKGPATLIFSRDCVKLLSELNEGFA